MWFGISVISDKKFKSNGQLKKHKASIHNIDVKWFPCDLCDKRFKSNGQLKKHKANIHDIDIVWYSCNICDYKTKQKIHILILNL